jgi:myosin heavy subunit
MTIPQYSTATRNFSASCEYLSIKNKLVMIWVPDKDYEWRLAEVCEIDESTSTVRVSLTNESLQLTALGLNKGFLAKKKHSIITNYPADVGNESEITASLPLSQTSPYDESHSDDLDDLCALTHLHEAPIINILRRRWMNNQIYTKIGDILISINPYKPINGLYDIPAAFYRTPSRAIFVPHVYVIAKRALECLKNIDVISQSLNLDQSIIVSGESGSGTFHSHFTNSTNIFNTLCFTLYVANIQCISYYYFC